MQATLFRTQREQNKVMGVRHKWLALIWWLIGLRYVTKLPSADFMQLDTLNVDDVD